MAKVNFNGNINLNDKNQIQKSMAISKMVSMAKINTVIYSIINH